MKKSRKGGWRTINERRYMRIRIGKKQRPVIPMTGVRTDAEADARCEVIADAVAKLLDAGRADRVEDLARELGAATNARAIETIRRVVTHVCETSAAPSRSVTFGDWAERWTSGELSRLYPDYIPKRSFTDEKGRLTNHILPHVGDVPIVRFTLEHFEHVMAKLPRRLGDSMRRHIAQIMHRLLAIAVYPGKLIPANPLPRGCMPRVASLKALTFLYPAEDAKLLGCTAVPLARRLVYGMLAREGMRVGELLGQDKEGQEREPMAWTSIDRAIGLIRLDVNKTDDPRAWAADPAVMRVLRWWYLRQGEPDVHTVVFGVHPRLGGRLRDDLETAGVDRPELFERSSVRRPIRVHDLRATFVTLSLANGKTETWVQDRTGHASSEMINRYRRVARTAAELHLGPLLPMDQLLPEMNGANVGQETGQNDQPPEVFQ